MKSSFLMVFLLSFLSVLSTGCEAVEGIFKAGMYWAFILVGLVVAVIIWIAVKARRK